jgi:hypothetical protein
MAKLRLLIMLLTFLVVGTVGTFAFYYAKGYRFDPETIKFSPNGLLVLKSYPDGAHIIIDGDLKTATNATIPLAPASYDVVVKKEGYREWSKRLTIVAGEVTEATAHLFRSAPSLSAMTFTSTLNPTPSRDFTKLSYVIPPNLTPIDPEDERSGLWVLDLVNLPLGFSREPRRVTDGDLSEAEWVWSPDGREILLTTPTGVFLLNTGSFTPQTSRVNVVANQEKILAEWQTELQKRREAQVRKLPNEVKDLLLRRSKEMLFSPDEDMVLYIASQSATLSPDLIKQLPGSSTQKQERIIKPGHIYVYDIKEDRNFLISDSDEKLTISGGFTTVSEHERRISWFPTSRHLILAESGKITIIDYDSTNRKEVYSGIYLHPHAYPALSTDRVIILTNLGTNSNPPFLYSLGLK